MRNQTREPEVPGGAKIQTTHEVLRICTYHASRYQREPLISWEFVPSRERPSKEGSDQLDDTVSLLGHFISGMVRRLFPDAQRWTAGGNMARIPLLQQFLFLFSVVKSSTKCLACTADMAIAMRLTTLVKWALLPNKNPAITQVGVSFTVNTQDGPYRPLMSSSYILSLVMIS